MKVRNVNIIIKDDGRTIEDFINNPWVLEYEKIEHIEELKLNQ